MTSFQCLVFRLVPVVKMVTMYYYNISYNPSYPELSSVNVTFVSVTPHQITTTFSYILRELFSGMNYTITVRAGNILGESSPVMILGETEPTGK